MKKTKKKVWRVVCEVDMCAEKNVVVYVTATKESLARKKAEEECKAKGHFCAFPFSSSVHSQSL